MSDSHHTLTCRFWNQCKTKYDEDIYISVAPTSSVFIKLKDYSHFMNFPTTKV